MKNLKTILLFLLFCGAFQASSIYTEDTTAVQSLSDDECSTHIAEESGLVENTVTSFQSLASLTGSALEYYNQWVLPVTPILYLATLVGALLKMKGIGEVTSPLILILTLPSHLKKNFDSCTKTWDEGLGLETALCGIYTAQTTFMAYQFHDDVKRWLYQHHPVVLTIDFVHSNSIKVGDNTIFFPQTALEFNGQTANFAMRDSLNKKEYEFILFPLWGRVFSFPIYAKQLLIKTINGEMVHLPEHIRENLLDVLKYGPSLHWLSWKRLFTNGEFTCHQFALQLLGKKHGSDLSEIPFDSLGSMLDIPVGSLIRLLKINDPTHEKPIHDLIFLGVYNGMHLGIGKIGNAHILIANVRDQIEFYKATNFRIYH